MQSNILKFKSYYFNISALIPEKRDLVLIAFCLILFDGCRREITKIPETVENRSEILENAVNINNATIEDLEKLPRVGNETARKIIEHREKFGKFRRVEHLILVKGMSDKKFREIRNFVKIE